jgi:hypothetical protein
MRRIDPKSMRRADAATTGEAKSRATTAAMSLATFASQPTAVSIPRLPPSRFHHSILADRNLRELPMTLTEESAMAGAAIAGDRVSPKNG